MHKSRLTTKEKWLGRVKRQFAKHVGALSSDQQGTSAIEFAFFASLLSLAALNVADVSIYIYQRMQLENAAQMGAQAVWKTCDPFQGKLPATTSCPALTTALTNAIQSTALGAQVTLQTGYPAEGYYCVNSSSSLQYVSAVTSRPADCSAAGMPSLQPADYIQIQTAFSYAPLFPGITVAGLFTTPITKTTMIRLN